MLAMTQIAADSLETVSVHALSAGHLSLPERFFVAPLDEDSKKTVPSLSFLIQHQSASTGGITRIVFDLGIRRDPDLYSENIRNHIATRLPLYRHPDVVESLSLGGLGPSDIDYVMFSHVHWDHVGMPSDFPKSYFIVGNGSRGLLDGSHSLNNGSHSHFESDLLPFDRVFELSSFENGTSPATDDQQQVPPLLSRLNEGSWVPLGPLPRAIDLFQDGSLWVIDAPGHLPGHTNLLCRVSVDPTRYIYLAGDACHDRRILTGTKEIAEWTDPQFPHRVCCIHANKNQAMETIKWIRELERGKTALGKVEVVLAHDAQWADIAKKQGRYFPGHL